MENSTLKKIKKRRIRYIINSIDESLWKEISISYEFGLTLNGFIEKTDKRGFFVKIHNVLPAFLPGSETGFENPKNFNQYIGKNLDFKVIEIINDEKGITIILSRIGVE